MVMTRTLSVTLDSDRTMPLIGLGTWELEGPVASRSVVAALETGYRHLDTATIYGNEADVGSALAESGVARDEVFVTTKCPPHRAGKELDTLRESLDMLGTDYVDLWLVHWPAGKRTLEMWRAFVE